MSGVDNQKLDTILHPDMLAYLRSVRQEGMRARFTGERKRVEASLHPNAKRNLGQVYTQLWKDVCKHRALVVARGHKDLRSTISSPFEAVDKLLPDRTISPDKRIVHDQRGVNYYTDKTWHPPAAQPTHRQVAKRILMWKMRLPGVKVLLAKKDVAGAFRLLWVAPQDAELFAGDVPWEPKQMACLEEAADEEDEEGEDMTIVYLVSSFGFSRSPGEWAIWGRATEEYHRAHRPAEPRRDLSYGFESKILVDDNILVEPWIGLRPWVSAENYEEGVRMMLGDAAVNADKDREEGTFRTQQTIWGLIMDTETEEVHLPERRVLKGAHLLAEEVFDAGRKDVTLRQLQILRGIATGWSVVVQGLKNELKAVDVFLGSVEPNGPVQPKVAAEANEEQRMKKEEQAWVDLWDLFETLRWLCSRSETWGTKRLCDLLAPRERLACPGQWEEVVFVTTDATPHMVGAIDWTHGFATRETTKVVGPWVRMAVEEDEEMQIHIAEFLSLVAFACEVAHRWAGKMVLFGGDNQLVRSWVTTRRSKVRACRLLIRVLNMIEMRYNCLVVGGWLRTYHNEDADYITRCTDEEFEEYLRSRGYQRVQLQGSIRQALLDSERFGPCFLSWGEDEDRTEILRLREQRLRRQIPTGLNIDWEGVDVREFAEGGRSVLDFEDVRRAAPVRPGPGAAEVFAGSLGPDEGQKGFKSMVSRIGERTWVCIVEGPHTSDWGWREEHMKIRGGWKTHVLKFVTTEFGECAARSRCAMIAWKYEVETENVEKLVIRAATARPLSAVVGKAQGGAESLTWVRPWKISVEPGIPRQPLLPQVVGHVWRTADSGATSEGCSGARTTTSEVHEPFVEDWRSFCAVSGDGRDRDGEESWSVDEFGSTKVLVGWRKDEGLFSPNGGSVGSPSLHVTELYAVEGEFGGSEPYLTVEEFGTGDLWGVVAMPKWPKMGYSQRHEGATNRCSLPPKKVCGVSCKTLHRSWNLGISVTWGEFNAWTALATRGHKLGN